MGCGGSKQKVEQPAKATPAADTKEKYVIKQSAEASDAVPLTLPGDSDTASAPVSPIATAPPLIKAMEHSNATKIADTPAPSAPEQSPTPAPASISAEPVAKNTAAAPSGQHIENKVEPVVSNEFTASEPAAKSLSNSVTIEKFAAQKTDTPTVATPKPAVVPAPAVKNVNKPASSADKSEQKTSDTPAQSVSTPKSSTGSEPPTQPAATPKLSERKDSALDDAKAVLGATMKKAEDAANDLKEILKQLAAQDKTMTEFIMNGQAKLSQDVSNYAEMAKGLTNNRHIVNIELAGVGMKDMHFMALVDALKTTVNLQKLNIESNLLTGSSIKALAAVIETHPSLKELRLDNQKNILGVEAERAIANALSQNTLISKLSFTCRDKSVKVFVDKFVQRNTDLLRKQRVSVSAGKSDQPIQVEKVPYPFPPQDAVAVVAAEEKVTEEASFSPSTFKNRPSAAADAESAKREADFKAFRDRKSSAPAPPPADSQ